MSNQVVDQIFVSAMVALIGAIINKLFSERINIWLVVLGVLVAVVLYNIYIMQANSPPFVVIAVILSITLIFVLFCRAYLVGFGHKYLKKWRVTNTKGSGLISEGELIGEKGSAACQFRTKHHECDIYGPYIHLEPEKYKATFWLKVGSKLAADQEVVTLDIARNGKPKVTLTLKYCDFRKADVYQDFSINFEISGKEGETDVEFRTNIPRKGTGPTLTLDYVQLSRRFF